MEKTHSPIRDFSPLPHLDLIEFANGELPRHAAVTKTDNLRKDKPNPVTGHSPGSGFSEDCGVDVLLGVEEAVDVADICHEQAS